MKNQENTKNSFSNLVKDLNKLSEKELEKEEKKIKQIKKTKNNQLLSDIHENDIEDDDWVFDEY